MRLLFTLVLGTIAAVLTLLLALAVGHVLALVIATLIALL